MNARTLIFSALLGSLLWVAAAKVLGNLIDGVQLDTWSRLLLIAVGLLLLVYGLLGIIRRLER